MFVLGMRAGRVASKPYIGKLALNNTRKGFFEWEQFYPVAGLGTEIRSADGKLIKKIGARIPHDFWRTAVRNLERSGVSRSDAMKMVGHKSEAIYRRYAISDEKSMTEAADKLDRFYAIDQQPVGTDKVTAK